MKVTKNITIDLNNPRRHVVHLMESGNQREIVLTLLKDGMPFDVSEGIGTATLVKGVGYIKANGVPGYYDWTSTDEAAVAAVSGTTNKWTVRLDEHATDVPGFAQIFVKFSLASGETLYSFPIVLDVIRTSGGTTDPDKPYYHSTSFLLAGAQDAKTPAMSFPVGVDGDGKLWAEGGWSAEAKEALLACFEQVEWKTPYGRTYLSALETALYPEVHLVSITAAYDQDRPIYNTDTWEQICTKIGYDLVVTANYSDGTSESVSDYTLSGDPMVGTNAVTVTYQGKTDTISVVVSADPTIYGYTAVGSPSIIDNVLYPADSGGGYIRSPREFSPTGAWRMQFAVKLASQSRQNVFMTADASLNRVQSIQCQAYYSAQYGYQVQFYISSTGSNWDLVSAKGFANLTYSAVQLIEYGFDGTKYYCKVSTDNGATWSEAFTMVSSTTKIYGGGYITVGMAQGTTPVFSGEIYLESLKVWQGDDLWWSAVYE